jgi:hypothetical protein
MKASSSKTAAPGTKVTGGGKTGIRTTMTNPFGKRAARLGKRGGRR